MKIPDHTFGIDVSQKTHILLMKVTAALVILGGSSTGFSMSDEEFNSRTIAAQQKLLAADQITRNIRDYEELRFRFIYANDSLFMKSKDVFKTASAWVARWREYMTDFDRINISDYEKFMTDSRTFMENQASDLEALDDAMEQVRRFAVDSESEFAAVFDATAQLTATQKRRVSELARAYEQLKTSIRSMGDKTGDKLGELRLIQDTVYRGINLKIKQRLLAQGTIPIESSLARYKDMQETVRLVLPLKHQLEKSANLMSEYTLNFGFQMASDLKTKASQQCVDSQKAIEDSGLGSRSKKASLEAIQGLCDAIEINWQALSHSGLSPQQMAAEFNSLMAIKYQDACKKANPAIDCQTYKILHDLDKTFFSNASTEDLKDLEYRWSSIDILNRK